MSINDYLENLEEKEPVHIDAQTFKRTLIQSIAVYMYKARVIKAPVLKYFNNQSLFHVFFDTVINEPLIKILKVAKPQRHLTVVGAQCLGAGAYIAECQGKFGKPVSDFGTTEVRQIALAFAQTDAYELALRTLGFDLNSNNKKVVDNIIAAAQRTTLKLVGDISDNNTFLKIYAETLYNAGVTISYKEHCRDFMNDTTIDLVNSMVESPDIHHIFPQKYCEDQGIKRQKYNSIVNKTPILPETNRAIGGDAPSIYTKRILKKVSGLDEKMLRERIESHLVNYDALVADDFDTYFIDRAKKLLGLIEEAMKKRVADKGSENTIEQFGSSLE